MKFENTEVWGFEHAVRGMRNPLNSWDKGDSGYIDRRFNDQFYIGKNDLDLAQRLIKAGSEHRKFSVDILHRFIGGRSLILIKLEQQQTQLLQCTSW